MNEIIERLKNLQEDLALRAYLFDDPATYREAVGCALDAVKAIIEEQIAA